VCHAGAEGGEEEVSARYGQCGTPQDLCQLKFLMCPHQ
jgi:hypothetical protein